MARANWTWIVYVATNNTKKDVSAFGTASIDQMRQAGTNEHVRVLVQQATPQGCQRLDLGSGLASDMGTVDSGDPATLLECIRWAATAAPADRYALVLWSHGSGWEPREMARIAQQQPAAVPVTEGELTQRSDDDRRGVFFSSTLRRLLAAPTQAERAFARDDGSGHSIDCVELGQVVAQGAQMLGQPFDLLGMNACQMASVEVVYQIRDHALVYVASEEDMPALGWPYAEILPRLAAQPAMDGPALGRLIVERYCAAFRANTSLPWGQGAFPAGATLVAVEPTNMAALAEAVAALGDTLRAAIDNDLAAIWAAHQAEQAFKYQLYDLARFCRNLAAQPGLMPATTQAALRVVTMFADPTLVLAQEHTAPIYDGVGGLTAYLMRPNPGISLSPYYAETDFAQHTRWGEFLAAYHAAAT